MTALCVCVRVCARLHESMCSPVHVHLGGRKLGMRSKANNFIGGLHNSAVIPGVIVFPLRLSCRDESLMHSCLRIMDGTGQLLPSPAAGAGSSGEMNGGEGESICGTCMDCGQRVERTKRGMCRRDSTRVWICVCFVKYVTSCSYVAYLGFLHGYSMCVMCTRMCCTLYLMLRCMWMS